MMEHIMLFHENRQGYVVEVADNRVEDSNFPKNNQEGVNIIMWHWNLLEKAASKPQIGHDGTVSTICDASDRSVDYELNALVAKGHQF